jgi:hypothetical protein
VFFYLCDVETEERGMVTAAGWQKVSVELRYRFA